MNAITVIEATPAIAPLDAWIATGRNLAARRRDVDWEIADWMDEGKAAGFLTQAGFEFLSENLGMAPKRLKEVSKAAAMFPPHMRDRALSVEHHVAVASLPKDEAMSLLHRASREHLQVNDLREAATQWRYEHGDMFEDDDKDSTLCTLIVRAWNRATLEARKSFMDLAKAAKLGIIDEDEAGHDEE